MSKRFTDTEKWKKKWFRSLSNDHKVFWVFLLDHCNHAGIWDVDFDFAEIFIGKIDETAIREAFKKQYLELESGKRWFIKDFVEFQYGELNPNNNLHRSVLALLEKSGAKEPLNSPSSGAKDKDKVKDKVIRGVVGEINAKFEERWNKYPKKLGKKEAIRHFKSSILTDQDLYDFDKALLNFIGSKVAQGDPVYIPHGSTWFNNWKDWVNYVEPITKQYEMDQNKETLAAFGLKQK